MRDELSEADVPLIKPLLAASLSKGVVEAIGSR